MGLVKQCITSMYKKNIQRLTKVGFFTFTENILKFHGLPDIS